MSQHSATAPYGSMSHGTDHATPSQRLGHHAHWFLRLALVGVFLYHGLGKFADINQFAIMMQLPLFLAILVALAETAGSVLVIVGAFTRDWITRIGAAMFIPVMIGAIAMVHWPQWNFMATESHPMGGMEFQVTLLFISLYLVFRGNRA